MNIYIDDIKNNDFLVKVLQEQSWGNAFLNLKKSQKFVLYYDLREKNSSYIVFGFDILYEINDLVYRKKSQVQAANVSWFQEPFATDTYFLYSFLRTAIIDSNQYATEVDENLKKLDNLFIGYKEKDFIDSKSRIKIKSTALQEVNSHISFSTAVNNIFQYNKKPIEGIKIVYDLLNQYTEYKYNRSIYGSILSHFAKAVRNPNGGLLPETVGTMRYMIIGEKVAKNDENLKRAKFLLRSLNSVKDIFYETGWYFSKLDGKWRKYVSDQFFRFKADAMTQVGMDFGVVPPYMNSDLMRLKQIAIEVGNNEKSILDLVKDGYGVKISDYIEFPEIFELYPDLKNVYSFFYISPDFSQPQQRIHTCYFNDEAPKCLVLISYRNYMDIGYVALHEMQHYIQNYEGFANGGNLHLADLISAVGGGAVREFLISLDTLKNEFKKLANLIPVTEYENLIVKLRNTRYQSYQVRYQTQFIGVENYVNSYIDQLTKLTSSPESINYFATTIITYLVEMYALVQETNGDIKTFVDKYIGVGYMKIFDEALHRNKQSVAKEQGMVQKGWNGYDLYTLSFETYKALGGELEARFTQQTTEVPTELRGYLDFLTSELVEPDKVTVISDEILVNRKDIAGGVELTDENKYIIHLFNNIDDSVVLLHETGHIIYDLCLKNPELIDNVIDGQMDAEKYGFEDTEEFFCEAFVDFVHRTDIESNLTLDMSGIRQIKNITSFDDIFMYILFKEKIKIDEEKLKSMLEFVKQL
jgi:hypothetical protein